MEPRVDVITLAVDDLERALRFYRDGLGFESRGIIGTQWTDEESEAAGAAVTTTRDRPWGIYSGYFRDLDGHLWEIIWNPNSD